jgi:large subunit ribosomal protein L25
VAEVKLNAVKRAVVGKGSARKARAASRVPAIVYGRGMDPTPIEVDRREFVAALQTDAGMNVLLEIQVDGDSTTALTRELQTDPVRGTLLHADFVKVDLTVAIEVEVPVHLVGEAAGAKEGGVLEQPLFTVQVKCLPSDVPEGIEADVSALNIGDSLTVASLPSDGKYEILTDPDAAVASVAAPISEEELEAMEAAVGEAAEGAEEVPEGEEAPEGEEGEEGEGEAPAEGGDEQGGGDQTDEG